MSNEARRNNSPMEKERRPATETRRDADGPLEERMNKRTILISGGRRLIFYSFVSEGKRPLSRPEGEPE